MIRFAKSQQLKGMLSVLRYVDYGVIAENWRKLPAISTGIHEDILTVYPFSKAHEYKRNANAIKQKCHKLVKQPMNHTLKSLNCPESSSDNAPTGSTTSVASSKKRDMEWNHSNELMV